MLGFIITLGIVATLGIIYSAYQMYRNNIVLDIRLDWIITKDERVRQYTYDEMYLPSSKNYYGLKIPRDEDFKLK